MKVDITKPQLTNLNEDPMLSGVVHHYLSAGETTIGRKDASPAPTIALTGLGVQKNHAIITEEGLYFFQKTR